MQSPGGGQVWSWMLRSIGGDEKPGAGPSLYLNAIKPKFVPSRGNDTVLSALRADEVFLTQGKRMSTGQTAQSSVDTLEV